MGEMQLPWNCGILGSKGLGIPGLLRELHRFAALIRFPLPGFTWEVATNGWNEDGIDGLDISG